MPSKTATQLENSLLVPTKELERAFNFFNAKFYAGKLPHDTTITIQSRPRSNAYGWFAWDRWEKGKKKQVIHEINIVPEHLRDSPEHKNRSGQYQPYATLLHEIVHYSNHMKKVNDCCVLTQYHNRKFKEEAERVLLVCEKSPKGYGMTDLSEKLKGILNREFKPNFNAFSMLRRGELYGDRPKRPTYLAKWVCSCEPPIIVRVSRGIDLQAECLKCNTQFERAGN